MTTRRSWYSRLQWIDQTALIMGLIGLAGLANGIVLWNYEAGYTPSFSGAFYMRASAGGELTKIKPSGCLLGRERGFDGLVALFPPSADVKEVWVDSERDPDKIVSVHFRDGRAPLQIHERDCEFVRGDHSLLLVLDHGRENRRLRGYTRFACRKAAGIEGSFSYDGCSPPAEAPAPAEWPRLKGRFKAKSALLGAWELEPMACLAGRERGFHGMLFQFRDGSAIRELRLDTEREGDNVLEVLFFETERDAVRVRERDCRVIAGSNTTKHLELNGRPLEKLTGWLHVECPSIGLLGWVKYNGCLPDDW